MKQLRMDTFLGVNETEDKLNRGQIPYGLNADFGNPIGAATKRGGLEAQIASLGAGGCKGIHTYKRSSGDVILFGHGTDLYKLSGDTETIVKTNTADFDAGTYDNTMANDELKPIVDVSSSETQDQSHVPGSAANTTLGTTSIQAQRFIPSVSNISSISIFTGSSSGWASGEDVTLTLYKWDTNYATTIAGNTLGSVTVNGPQSTSSEIKFTFATPIDVISGDAYLFVLTINTGSIVIVEYPGYTSGTRYLNGVDQSDDLHFRTYYKDYLNGEWLSPVYDLTITPKSASLSWNDTTPTTTSVVYKARGSSDNVNFGDWQTIVNNGEGIPLARYIQLQIALTADGENYASVQDFTITYESEWTTATSIKSDMSGDIIRFVDYNDRCFFVDGGRPHVYNGTEVFALGVDPPSTAPTLAIGSANGMTGAYTGVVTFVNAAGAESNASPVSGSVTVSNTKINWSAIPTGPVETTSKRRLYRTKANAPGIFYFVTEINNNTTTTYTDSTADSLLLTSLLLLEDNNIPYNASIIHEHKNILFVVDSDNPRRLVFSKVAGFFAGYASGGFDVFPPTYIKLFPKGITAVKSFANAVIVSGEGYTKAIYGDIFGGPQDNTVVVDIDSIGALSHEGVVECIDPQQRVILIVPTKEGIKYLTRGLQDNSLEAAPLSANVQRYFDKSTNRPSQAAIFFDSRFYVAFTHYEDSEPASYTNNKVLVYDFRTNEWYPAWTMNINSFTESNGKLYGCDSTKGIVYEMNKGTSDNGEDIPFVIDISARFPRRISPYRIKLEASLQSVPDNLEVKVQIDNAIATKAPGIKDLWVQSAAVKYGQQDTMKSPNMQFRLGRGNYLGVRISETSTNPLTIYSMILDYMEGAR